MLKYIRLNSLTFWTLGAAPFLAGIVMATTPLHGLTAVSYIIANATGGMESSALLILGLGGMGLRKAIG